MCGGCVWGLCVGWWRCVFEVLGPRFGLRSADLGSVCGSDNRRLRFEVRRLRFEVRGPRFEVFGPRGPARPPVPLPPMPRTESPHVGEAEVARARGLRGGWLRTLGQRGHECGGRDSQGLVF